MNEQAFRLLEAVAKEEQVDLVIAIKGDSYTISLGSVIYDYSYIKQYGQDAVAGAISRYYRIKYANKN